jgi:hypothetical protein
MVGGEFGVSGRQIGNAAEIAGTYGQQIVWAEAFTAEAHDSAWARSLASAAKTKGQLVRVGPTLPGIFWTNKIAVAPPVVPSSRFPLAPTTGTSRCTI